MTRIRYIARLDIKGANLIKGIQMEGLRKLGHPAQFAEQYYRSGIDEILYVDNVASLYNQTTIIDTLKKTASNVFVPITVAGGVRGSDDVARLLDNGADKIAINTAAILDPNLIEKLAQKFGNQCIVLSVEAKSLGPRNWEAYYNNGREKTGKDVLSWVTEAVDRGVGEVLLTSVDQDGTMRGLDIDLAEKVSDSTQVPLILSGGLGNATHLPIALRNFGIDAIAIGSALHYKKITVKELKETAKICNREVRED